MRAAFGIVRVSLTDRLRDRKLLVAELLPNLAIIGFLVVMGAVTNNADRGGNDRESFSIGVSGDIAAVDGLAAHLAARHFEIVPVEDPVRSVLRGQTEVVLVLGGADLTAATVVDRSGSDGSRVTGLLLRAALADHARVIAGEPPVAATEQVPKERRSPEGIALLIAFIPLVFAGSAGRGVLAGLTGARDAGTLEVQLSLPVGRRGLLGAVCLAEMLVSLVKEGLFIGLGLLGVLAVGIAERSLLVGLLAAALAVVAVLAYASIMALVGVLAAAGSAVSRFLVGGVAFVAVYLLVMFSQGEPGPLPAVLAGIPGVGLSVGVRELLVGHPAGSPLLIGVLVTGAAVAVLGRLAVRALDSEDLASAGTSA